MFAKETKYKLGFTAGALLLKEAEVLIDAIQDEVAYMEGEEHLEEGVLTTKFESSKKRLKQELDKRLRNLEDPEFLRLFSSLEEPGRNLLLFYAAAKYYNIIADFMLEVVRNKWMNMDVQLLKEDFLNYLFLKADKHVELDSFSEGTKSKAGEVTLKMLKELGMLDKKKLQKINPSPELLQLVVKNNDSWFLDALLLGTDEKLEYV